MQQLQVEHSLGRSSRPRTRPRKRNPKPVAPKPQRMDAATVAASLQLQEQQRDLVYSFIALGLKFGLLFVGAVSLVKLSVVSHQRLDRYGEVATVLEAESTRLYGLQNRFDRFFTIGGDKRLMDEQEQWIAPNRVRIIWR